MPARRMEMREGKAMLIQIQFRDVKTGETELVAQTEINAKADQDDLCDRLCKWAADVRSRHELPDGNEWFLCNEMHPRFKLAVG